MEEMIQKAVSEAIQQVPSLVVLGVIVWLFIKVIFRFIKHIEDRGQIMQELHKEHIDARELARQAINDNTATMRANTQAITTLTSVVDRIKNSNQRH